MISAPISLAAGKGKFDKNKVILIITLSIVAMIMLYVIGRKVSSLIRAARIARDNKSEHQVLAFQGMRLSYSKSWYEQQGRRLYNAMKSTWYDPTSYGTDENTIYSIFGALKNDLDFLELFSAFGIKGGYDLQEWIDGDLNQGEKDKINRVLKNKGITKRI